MAEIRELTTEDPALDVIETLEAMLAKARAGEVSAVGIAWVTRNGRGAQNWSTIPNLSLLIGSAGRLVHHLNRVADEQQ